MATTTLTFDQLADLEPRLHALEKLVELAAPSANGDPAYTVFLTAVKPLVVALVGWHRGWLDVRETIARPDTLEAVSIFDMEMPSYPRPDNEVEALLRTSDAYDVVYDHLNEMLGQG